MKELAPHGGGFKCRICGAEEPNPEVAEGKPRSEPLYPPHDPALPVVCFDFDGVFAENKWPSPEIGVKLEGAAEAVEHYYNAGCQIIILTARPESHFPWIREWLTRRYLAHMIYDITNRKPAACIYFDDRAYRWPLA